MGCVCVCVGVGVGGEGHESIHQNGAVAAYCLSAP